jgi:hypothetical protein
MSGAVRRRLKAVVHDPMLFWVFSGAVVHIGWPAEREQAGVVVYNATQVRVCGYVARSKPREG